MANAQQHIKHYTLVDIERYIQGKMSPEEMHVLEKVALQDPFVADALEGYTHMSTEEAKIYLQKIQQQLLNNRQQKNKRFFKNTWFKVAASVISICSVGAILWAVLGNENDLSNTLPNEQQILPPSEAIISPPNNIPVDKAPHQPNKKIAEPKKPMLEQQKSTPPVELSPINETDISIQKEEEDVVKKSPQAAPITYKGEDNRLRTGYEKKDMGRQERKTDDTKNKELPGIAKKSKDEFEATKLSTTSTPITNQAQGMAIGKKYRGSVTNDKIIQDTDATPEGGWPAFETYVQSKITTEKQYVDDALLDSLKAIELTFLINEDGKPYNIQTVHSSGNTNYDHKIISIIQEGPRWTTNKENKRVKINIELP